LELYIGFLVFSLEYSNTGLFVESVIRIQK
jgi:hypothetical protein